LLSEQGETKADARGEVRGGLGAVDLEFPRPEVRHGGLIWVSDFG
jgi:hypothetical protein